MNENHILKISTSLSVKDWQVKNTIQLFDEGATMPFISRYRKEATGSLDEVQIAAIKDQFTKLLEIDSRRETILKSIDEQGKLTDDLKKRIEEAQTLTELEDIYLPYKQKKKTRATKAKEKGLEPLAKIIMKQQELNIISKAEQFINDEIPSVDDALQGARDIVAEWINENERARNSIRRLFQHESKIQSKAIKGKELEGIKFKDYFEWEEPLKRCPSHRLLAMRRGENEGFLKITISPDEEKALEILENQFVSGVYDVSEQVREAVKDSYKRLLSSSMETEFKNSSKDIADEEAIKVFADNLRQLLLAPPLGQKNILAIDPGYRTGCKMVCIDTQGNLLHNETIYPHQPQNEKGMAMKKIDSMVETFKIDAIAIGNGTASRETEALVKRIRFSKDVRVFVVSEDGASIYSASSVAREEFPEYDVTVRGAVSIGRRLMDPLAELVKIDPKSIGVGQYQHDVDQNKLKGKLDQVVESSVNNIGVNLNTSSKHLLTYISGLGPQLAKNIVDYRKENGAFNSRKELQKVKRMGDKAFQQAAGFLRIDKAENPLDNSAVHPESYHIVEKMASDLNCEVIDIIKNEDLRKQIKLENYISKDVGLPTLNDIIKELAKPGRDPRQGIKVFEFAEGIHKIEDLH
ncbi:MAG: RNA-binding transcriptional accessory protein, partial [Bacteroidales bacterium]|nr:RNA-binding transcriptional accessory protein [Bacteroidales bacterium]